VTPTARAPENPRRWLRGHNSARRLVAAGSVLAAVVAADQLSKEWAYEVLRPRGRKVLVPGWLELDFTFNTGAAFGSFSEVGGARTAFIVFTCAALLYMGWLLRRLPAHTGLGGSLGLGLMAGGAVGNLVDRLTRVHEVALHFQAELPFWALIEHPREIGEAMVRGRPFANVPRHGVVDFLVVYYWPGERWPSFNVADAALVLGVGVFLLYLARHGRALTEPT